jgi:hypothetical protein
MTTLTIPVEVCDGAKPVLTLGLLRCDSCGHRSTVNGTAPVETRKQPWRAPAEIIGRRMARKAGQVSRG